jgi:hypothetical protein
MEETKDVIIYEETFFLSSQVERLCKGTDSTLQQQQRIQQYFAIHLKEKL